jgi:hypothetical protein
MSSFFHLISEFWRFSFQHFVSPLPPPLSYPLCHDAPMKMNLLDWLKQDEGETMARFGEAKLVKRLNGKIELVGGTPEDRADAREWCSLFLHESVLAARSHGSIRNL